MRDVNQYYFMSFLKPFSTRTVFKRQNLAYKDGPRIEILKIPLMAVDPWHRYIQINQKQLANTFKIHFSNCKTPLVSMVYTK